ncbi:hypothetical protein TNCV_430571 [Trichonephila clavipes]|nr:hypothetical protein TNCV_430571 [Trichonephila clavipes]
MASAARNMKTSPTSLTPNPRVLPQYAQRGSWRFVHDNAHPHTANIVKQFLEQKRAEQIKHPPYSPDLNGPDFFRFTPLKLALKGNKFDDTPDIQRNVTKLLNSIPKRKPSCKVSRVFIADHSSAYLWEVIILMNHKVICFNISSTLMLQDCSSSFIVRGCIKKTMHHGIMSYTYRNIFRYSLAVSSKKYCCKTRCPPMQGIVTQHVSPQHCFESNVPRIRISMQGTDLENVLAIRDVEYPRCLDNPEQRVFDNMLRCRP